MRRMICATGAESIAFGQCRMKYRACRMRRPPVLNRRRCKLVSDLGRAKPYGNPRLCDPAVPAAANRGAHSTWIWANVSMHSKTD